MMDREKLPAPMNYSLGFRSFNIHPSYVEYLFYITKKTVRAQNLRQEHGTMHVNEFVISRVKIFRETFGRSSRRRGAYDTYILTLTNARYRVCP